MEDYRHWCFEALCDKYSELMKKIPMSIKNAEDGLFFGNFLFSGFFVNNELKIAGNEIAKLDYLVPELQSCWFNITHHIKVKGVPHDIIVKIFSFVDPSLNFEKPVFKLYEAHLENLESLEQSGGRRELIRW